MSRSSGLVKPERKTRRTHKNSRDGCPNCRAKRIKCTEELPSCSNCVRKNYRCGYLDFPLDRLDHIRRKNDQKHSMNLDQPDNSTPLLDTGTGKLRSENSLAPSLESTLRGRSVSNGAQKSQTLFSNRSENFRSQVYSAIFSNLNDNDISVIRDMQRAELKPWQDLLSMYENSMATDLPDISSINTHWPTNLDFNTPAYYEPRLSIKKEYSDFDFPDTNNTEHSTSRIDPNSSDELSPQMNDRIKRELSPEPGDEFKSGHKRRSPQEFRRHGSPLPNAINRATRFPKNNVPSHLKNPFLENALRSLKDGTVDVRRVTNDKFNSVIQPVWKEELFQKFWLAIFHQASMLNLYFVYFIDKAVNISKRTAQIIVNGEFENFSNHPSASLYSNASSPLSNQSFSPTSLGSRYSEFFYNPEDLKRLNRLLYVTYGRLLRALRESTANYHEEYPIKMSMFSAWACFWNTSSDISTLCMMFTGALTLANRLLTEAQTISDVSVAVRQEIMILNNHSTQSIIPDFLLDAIRELSDTFSVYKRIVSDLLYNHDNGLVKYDYITASVLQNPIFKHNIKEMSAFLKKLQSEFIPQMRALDSHYKNLYGVGNMSLDFKFVSPTLIYNMTYDWFRVFRGDKFSMVSNTSIIHRILSLFFHALGRCLAQCLPIRCTMLLDPCYVIAPKVGFHLPQPNYENMREFESLSPIDMGLIRMIKFFEYRQALFGYHTGHSLVSDYVHHEANPAPPEFEYKDIVRLGLDKLRVPEVHPEKLLSGQFNAQNFPIFEEISQDPRCYNALQRELERQAVAMRAEPLTFDYSKGLSNHDFQPEQLLQVYLAKLQAEKMTMISPGLEELRVFAQLFSKSGNELINAINKNKA